MDNVRRKCDAIEVKIYDMILKKIEEFIDKIKRKLDDLKEEVDEQSEFELNSE
jgi:hypothetical protein